MKSRDSQQVERAVTDRSRAQRSEPSGVVSDSGPGGAAAILLQLQQTHGNRFVQRLIQRDKDADAGKPLDPDTLGRAFVKKKSEVETLRLKKGTVKSRVEGVPYVLFSPHSQGGAVPLRGLVEGSDAYQIRAGEIYQQVWAQQEGKPANSFYWGRINSNLVEYSAPPAASVKKDDTPAVDKILNPDKAASSTGDPQSDSRYIENAIQSVDIPLPGYPFYLKGKGLGNDIVVPRNLVDLYSDPLKDKVQKIALIIVYKSREEADQAVAANGIPGTYTFYEGPENVIFPTIISDTTAPILCGRLREQLRIEAEYADAASKLLIEAFLTGLGFRYPISAVDSAEALSAGKALPKATPSPAAAVSLLEQLKSILGNQFAELEAAAKLLKSTKPELANMTLEEIIAVRSYTRQFAYTFNRAMRLKDVVEIEKWRPLINLIRSGLEKLPRYEGVVRRGVSTTLGQMPEYKVGATIVEEAFTSSTVGQVSLQHRGPVTFIIESLNGRNIQTVASTQEGEVLFLPGTKFLVTKVVDFGEKFGTTLKVAGEIYLKEIL